MNDCFYSKKRKAQTYANAIACCVLGCLFLAAFGYLVYALIQECDNARHWLAILFYILLSLFPATGFLGSSGGLFLLGWKNYWIYTRKFLINHHGIDVIYCNGTSKFYPWEQFADVCICDVNHNYGGGFDTVIRLGLHTEKNGPLNPHKQYGMDGREKWRNEWYLFSHYKEVICLEYSKDRMDQVSEFCPKIIDRRTKTT